MASEGRRPTRNRRVAVRHVATRRFIDVLGCEQPRAVDPGKRGLGNLPATTRPRQRVQPEAAGGWVAAGSDRQSGGLADRGERGVAGVQLCALFLFGLLATWTVVASRTQALSGPCYATACWPARHPRRLLPGLLTGSPVRNQKGRQRHADRPTDLAKSIGALGTLDPERGLAPTLQQIADSASSCSRPMGPGSCWSMPTANCAGPAPRTRPPRRSRMARSGWPRGRVRWRSASGSRPPSVTSVPNRTGPSSLGCWWAKASVRP
jgi:hypothetical protein